MAYRSSNPVFKEENFREKMRAGEGAEAIHAPSAEDLDRMYGAQGGQQGRSTGSSQQAQYGQQGYGQVGAPAGPNYAAGDLSVGQRSDRMVMGDVLNKMTIMLGLIIASGAAAWFIIWSGFRAQAESFSTGMPGIVALLPVAAIGAFVIALVNQFKKVTSPALSVIYAVLEGFVLGAISAVAEIAYPGIALQAILGTVMVFAVTLGLFRSGKYRTSPRMTRIVMVAAMAYLAFCIVNLGLMFFTGTNLRSGLLGLGIGLIAVLIGTYFLVMDFEFIQNAIKAEAPKQVAWTCAFGLTLTLVWIYIEILRLLMIIRSLVDR